MSAESWLYPAIEPYQTHRLAVDPPHELAIEESGNPDGIPVLFLHGGPGAGARPSQRRYFDPKAFRIILFDQRGAGKSTPTAELSGNTTAALIADIERIRKHLGIERWLITGGSWGSCLALAYGQAHPESCLGFRLHGIFLGQPEEVRWWFHGVRSLFPDRWEDFAAFVPDDERHDLLAAYYKRLTADDPALRLEAATRLRTFSAWTQTFIPDPDHVNTITEPAAALALSRIFAHYCTNAAFLEPNQLLDNIDRIRHLPAEIIQGRYDVVTPMVTAWALKQAWPEARFTIVDEANHVTTARAPALGRALRAATDRFRDTLSVAAGQPTIGAFLDIPASKKPAVSFDGESLAYLSDESGTDQVWFKPLAADQPAQRVTSQDEPVGALAFNPKTRDLLFTMDCGGDERHQLWLLPQGAEEAVPLTDDPTTVHAWGAWGPQGKRIAYAANSRDRSHMDLYVMEVESRETRCVLEGEGWRQPLAFYPDGSALLVQDSTRAMSDQDLFRLDLETGTSERLLPHEGRARYLAPKFRKDGSGFYLITDQGREFLGLAFFNLKDKSLEWLVTPSSDIEALALSPDQQTLAYVVNLQGWNRVVLRDCASGAETMIEGHPPGTIASVVFTPDSKTVVFPLDGATSPPAIWRHAIGSQGVAALTTPGTIAGARLVEPEVAEVESFDLQPVPILVYRPESPPPAEGYPTVVVVHGGPEAQWTPNWRADVQYLLSRGIMVVAPNVRGSTGYGRTWQHLDDRLLRMDSVADLKAVRLWLGERQDVDAGRIAVYGRSYGGFMVLAALIADPDLWKVGVEFYGIASFLTMLETTGPWRKQLRAYEYGDPVEDKEALERFSPLSGLARIKVPLLIAQGLDDPRVPPGESEMIYSVLRGLGREVDYIRIPHEGHGFARIENRHTVFGAFAAFIERHLA